MDDVLEDKICDLYGLFVDGLDDDDAGPQVRKLYVELAELWSNGFMDNHGIPLAICRAKERCKDEETLKRKKMLAPRPDETAQVEASSVPWKQYEPSDSGGPVLAVRTRFSNSSCSGTKSFNGRTKLGQTKTRETNEAKTGIEGALLRKR